MKTLLLFFVAWAFFSIGCLVGINEGEGRIERQAVKHKVAFYDIDSYGTKRFIWKKPYLNWHGEPEKD